MSSPPRVMMASADRAVLRKLVTEFPRGRFAPAAAFSASQLASGYQRGGADVILIWEALEDMEGEACCRWLREQLGPSVPLVLLVSRLPPRTREQPPYDAVLRFPAGPGVVADKVSGFLQRQQAGGGEEAFIAEVQRRLGQVESQDYYGLLGVSSTAGHDAIRAAYDQLSLRFHPDKHLGLRDAAGLEALKTLYVRIGEAYRVLTDPRKKAAYDRQLKGGQVRYDEGAREKEGPKSLEDLSENPRVKRFLKLAQVSLGSGNVKGALQNLKFARSLDPGNDLLKEKIDELERS